MKEMEAWVARDKDGKIYLYRYKPIKDKFVWYSDRFQLSIGERIVPRNQWSDDEPTKVSITIKK